MRWRAGSRRTSSWRTRRICCSLRPATANTIAKLATGIANDALSCVALALNARAKTLVAPAMNGKMWLHPATQQNVATLKSRGVEFIGPEEGLLSCGYEGWAGYGRWTKLPNARWNCCGGARPGKRRALIPLSL